MAFVSAVPVTGRARVAAVSTSVFVPVRHADVVRSAPVRRARIVAAAGDDDRSIPQGFTFFSEQLNGRAAMVGFALALVTEALTGQGIIGQLGSVAHVVKGVAGIIN